MENNMVAIPVREHDELVRDSEKVRILTQAIMDGVDPGDYWLRVICGVQEQEPIEIKIEDREPAMAPQEVFTESEEVEPPYEPAISIEKIEDDSEEDDFPEPANNTPRTE